jgi:chemotaxis methyl-accepting protein methylase
MSGHHESSSSSSASFFRDPEVFDQIATTLVPELLANKPHAEPLRAWCPGCMTGEEAYSLAMVLVEELESRGVTRPIQVFATDCDGETIAQARHGVFDANIADAVGGGRLDRFFHAFATGYRVNQPLRNKVIFAPHDLARDAPFARIDLILCRGVLTRFERALQDRVMRGLQRGLQPWGYLVAGASETVISEQLERAHEGHPFYRNTGAVPTAVYAVASATAGAPDERTPPAMPEPKAPAVNHAVAGGAELRAALGELAATRHELTAVRNKLSHTREDTRQRLAVLERQACEQRDLLAATGLAMLFVDRELRIQHHTPPLQQLIHVWPHDRGRPISDLTSCLDYRELAGDLRQVVDTLAPIECEVCDRTGRPFLVRLSPHRRGDEVVGAVATFIDIAHVRGTAVQRRAAGR